MRAKRFYFYFNVPSAVGRIIAAMKKEAKAKNRQGNYRRRLNFLSMATKLDFFAGCSSAHRIERLKVSEGPGV